MKVNYIILCDHAIPPHQGQKASIIGIFQRINPPTLPTRYPRFFVVFEVQGDSVERGPFDLQLRILPEARRILQAKETR